MSADEGVFEPLRGKRRRVRDALTEVAERWTARPLEDAAARKALENAVRHLLRRGQIRKELPASANVSALAQSFMLGLIGGKGKAAVDQALGSPAEPDDAANR